MKQSWSILARFYYLWLEQELLVVSGVLVEGQELFVEVKTSEDGVVLETLVVRRGYLGKMRRELRESQGCQRGKAQVLM